MNSANFHYERGLALHGQNRLVEALADYDASIVLKPGFPDAFYNRALALWSLGRQDEALGSMQRATVLNPRYFEALYNHGVMAMHLRRLEQALKSFDACLAVKPDYVEALNNRAGTLQSLGRLEEALQSCERAIGLAPQQAGLHYNRGTILEFLNRHEEALASYEKAFALDPAHPDALGCIAGRAMQICDWARVADLAEIVTRRVAQRNIIIAPHLFLRYSDDPALQQRCAEAYVQDRMPTRPRALWQGAPYRHKKIRVAYLSSDFHQHATAHLMAELFELHDRENFEITAISFGEDDKSDMRKRLVGAFDAFHDVASKPDAETAALIRSLEIDIAVDLKGHTQGSRPEILNYRPAPVQVSYLGYPGTTAMRVMDYVLADRIALPFAQQPYYCEKIVHLPDCYQPNDRMRRIAQMAPTRAAAGLPQDAFVFCCFNSSWKITAPLFDIWARLLNAVPGSVLWLLDDNDATKRNLRAEIAKRGLDADRLVFAPRMALDDHLARHRLADLFLDTLPVNAHTTASDALWAGLPVVTCLGRAFAGRVAASLLGAVGLGELAVSSLDGYEALARSLAQNPEKLRAVRQQLAQNLSTQKLFDTDALRRNLEAAYRRMHDIAERSLPPQSFAVEPAAGAARP